MTMTESANWIALLPEDVREKLQARMVKRTFSDGEYIYRHGELGTNQYQITSGSVRLRVLADSGKEVTYVIYGPGDCIGYISAIDRGPRPQDAIAIGTVEANCLNVNEFEQLRDQHPSIDRALCLQVTRRARDVFHLYESGNFFALRRRLANQMLFLLTFAGQASVENNSMQLALTQEMLATSVCATRQAVSKLLKEWADAKIIDYRYGNIHIIDIDQLQQIAEGKEIDLKSKL